jgi:hypothetical protein
MWGVGIVTSCNSIYDWVPASQDIAACAPATQDSTATMESTIAIEVKVTTLTPTRSESQHSPNTYNSKHHCMLFTCRLPSCCFAQRSVLQLRPNSTRRWWWGCRSTHCCCPRTVLQHHCASSHWAGHTHTPGAQHQQVARRQMQCAPACVVCIHVMGSRADSDFGGPVGVGRERS